MMHSFKHKVSFDSRKIIKYKIKSVLHVCAILCFLMQGIMVINDVILNAGQFDLICYTAVGQGTLVCVHLIKSYLIS